MAGGNRADTSSAARWRRRPAARRARRDTPPTCDRSSGGPRRGWLAAHVGPCEHEGAQRLERTFVIAPTPSPALLNPDAEMLRHRWRLARVGRILELCLTRAAPRPAYRCRRRHAAARTISSRASRDVRAVGETPPRGAGRPLASSREAPASAATSPRPLPHHAHRLAAPRRMRSASAACEFALRPTNRLSARRSLVQAEPRAARPLARAPPSARSPRSPWCPRIPEDVALHCLATVSLTRMTPGRALLEPVRHVRRSPPAVYPCGVVAMTRRRRRPCGAPLRSGPARRRRQRQRLFLQCAANVQGRQHGAPA